MSYVLSTKILTADTASGTVLQKGVITIWSLNSSRNVFEIMPEHITKINNKTIFPKFHILKVPDDNEDDEDEFINGTVHRVLITWNST